MVLVPLRHFDTRARCESDSDSQHCHSTLVDIAVTSRTSTNYTGVDSKICRMRNIMLLGSNSGKQFWEAILGSNSGKQIWGATSRNFSRSCSRSFSRNFSRSSSRSSSRGQSGKQFWEAIWEANSDFRYRCVPLSASRGKLFSNAVASRCGFPLWLPAVASRVVYL